jgi:hypothetical protein
MYEKDQDQRRDIHNGLVRSDTQRKSLTIPGIRLGFESASNPSCEVVFGEDTFVKCFINLSTIVELNFDNASNILTLRKVI